MMILETIYRVYDEGMIVEELDEVNEEDLQAQELPIYQNASDPVENPLPVH
jgi:hypothetical protein